VAHLVIFDLSVKMSKKGEEPEKKPILGRPGANLAMGIVGLPNVGKSSLFNILTNLQVPAENYPFTTIDPNVSRVSMPDKRYDWLVNHFKPASKVPAFLQVTDIAGLIRGASTGAGLGNQFLSHIRAVDGIYHVVRIFEDADVTHVEDSIDAVRDLEIITEELLQKDIETITKHRESVEKLVHRDKTKKAELEIVQKIEAWVVSKKEVRLGDWKTNEIEVLNSIFLLTAKPVVYLVNMSEGDFIKKKNPWLAKIKKWVDGRSKDPIIPFSAAFEQKLMDMTPEEATKYTSSVSASSSMPKIIKTGYDVLELIYFFTCGEDEVKCWTIRAGTKAPQAAGVIHTDFEKGFICAEVMAYIDYVAGGSEAAVKAAGKFFQQGKNYTVVDGDIIFFKFNAGAGLKGKK